MMELQEIFNRIKENKKKQKDIRSAFKDALASSMEYKEITDKIITLREKKKRIEGEIRSGLNSELGQLDDIKHDISTDAELLSDTALSMIMKGQTVAVKDEYDNDYEPIFSVKFKKT